MLVNPKNFRDSERFGIDALSGLRRAATDLGWLLDRAYPLGPSLDLVGDRWTLDARQRLALRRCAATAAEVADRGARQVATIAGRVVALDAFNVLTTARVLCEGGLVLRGRDAAHRDLAGQHRRARDAEATWQAAQWVAAVLAPLAPAAVCWVLDAPVSGSGALAARLRALGHGAELANDADAALLARPPTDVLVSADGRVIDGPHGWFDLAGHLARQRPDAWVVAPFAVDARGGAGQGRPPTPERTSD